MSITRGIEVIKKDGTKIDDNRYVSWKNWNLDMWISEYLFDKNDLTCVSFGKYDECFECIIPNEVVEKMGEILKNRQFDVCEAYRFFDDIDEEYALRYGDGFIWLVNKTNEDESLRYYDCGN